MGKKKSTTTNKPIYGKQIEGAANTATDVYNANAGKLQAGADQFGTLRSSILDKYMNGTDELNAAKGHFGDVLSGKYLNGNPHLQSIIDQTGNSVLNKQQAALGTRGLTGGSAYMDIASRALADNESALRYQDYNTQSNRMDSAASSVGSITNAEGDLLNQALSAYQAQAGPIIAANNNASTIGGLLGQYQTQKTVQKGNLLDTLAQIAGNASQSFSMIGG